MGRACGVAGLRVGLVVAEQLRVVERRVEVGGALLGGGDRGLDAVVLALLVVAELLAGRRCRRRGGGFRGRGRLGAGAREKRRFGTLELVERAQGLREARDDARRAVR